MPPFVFNPRLSNMKLLTLKCKISRCQTENLRNASHCKKCGNSLGFVTVNLLSDPYFQDGLEARYRAVIAELGANGTADEVKRFEKCVLENGKAVINMDSKLLFKIVNENEDYLSYQRAVEQGKRVKADFENDQNRCVVESAFYGYDGRNIVYAALSLDEKGLESYGDVSVVLRTEDIEARSTIFETNTYFLFDELVANGWRVRELMPPGHCGTWNERVQIASIKHSAQIRENQGVADFAALILRSDGDRKNDVLLELHIFNQIGPYQFEKVNIEKKTASKFKLVESKVLKLKLADLGVTISGI